MQDGRSDVVIPVVEETARLDKVVRETGRVRVTTGVSEQIERVEADLQHEDIEVTRIPRDETVASVPPIRIEGDVTVYPVVEEVLVVERRLVLREEVHVTRRRRVEHVAEDVAVRRTEARVERTPSEG